MFGTNKNSNEIANPKNNPASNTLSVNSLVPGTTIEGKVYAKNDIRIDGAIDGNLECEGKLIVGKEGKIDGEILCANAVIEGKIVGKLRVRELLHVKSSAHIDGEVKTGQLLVDPGGIINGTCDMGSQKIKNLSPSDQVTAEVGT